MSVELAKKFHDTYERLAPQFGYETRGDTKRFDPETPNGRLMIAVCSEVLSECGTEIERLREDNRRHNAAMMTTQIYMSLEEEYMSLEEECMSLEEENERLRLDVERLLGDRRWYKEQLDRIANTNHGCESCHAKAEIARAALAGKKE